MKQTVQLELVGLNEVAAQIEKLKWELDVAKSMANAVEAALENVKARCYPVENASDSELSGRHTR